MSVIRRAGLSAVRSRRTVNRTDGTKVVPRKFFVLCWQMSAEDVLVSGHWPVNGLCLQKLGMSGGCTTCGGRMHDPELSEKGKKQNLGTTVASGSCRAGAARRYFALVFCKNSSEKSLFAEKGTTFRGMWTNGADGVVPKFQKNRISDEFDRESCTKFAKKLIFRQPPWAPPCRPAATSPFNR